MTEFVRISSVNNPLFADLFTLYCLSFPVEERRSWSGLEYEIMYNKRFFASAIRHQDAWVGLLFYWDFEQFLYIEHFAIFPAMRDRLVGETVLNIFLNRASRPVVLETELPDTPVAVRRLDFYKRQGFSVLNMAYHQPPYEANLPSVPLLLLCNDASFAEANKESVCRQLYSQVYHVEEF